MGKGAEEEEKVPIQAQRCNNKIIMQHHKRRQTRVIIGTWSRQTYMGKM